MCKLNPGSRFFLKLTWESHRKTIEAVGEISIPNGIHGEPSFKPHTNSKFKAVDKLNKAIYAQLERLNSSLPETNDIIENKVEPAIDTKSALVHALA